MRRPTLVFITACLGLVACGDDGSSNDIPSDDASASSDASTTSSPDAGSMGTDASTPTTTSDAGAAVVGTLTTSAGAACAQLTPHQTRVACAANAMLATLDATQLGTVNLQLTDYVNRTKWNNLPVMLKPRAGAQMGTLSSGSQAAVLDMMNIALNDNGQTTMTGILRADDYLASMQGGYGSDLYSVAVFGTPSASNDFEIMFGGHHMAYNLHFVGSVFYPVPQHLGCEPKDSFTINGASYAPMKPKGDAMFAVYASLDDTQKTTGYLSGQSFSDVVVNPDLDYGKGQDRTSKAAYPTGSNRTGVLVSSMTSAQQALVTAAVEEWVRQYPVEVADGLMTAYAGAYADTYFAWGGDSSGADKDVSGSYLRIDGTRLWIELAVQGGIVIRDKTHYHTIYHDKTYDYGGQF